MGDSGPGRLRVHHLRAPQPSTTRAAQPELVGAFAEAVQERMCDHLQRRCPEFEWSTEYYVERTPVDVAGERSEHLVLVELEWRRADPVANPAKVFRHGVDGALDGYQRLTLCQVFSRYYDLDSGGVTSKRKDAEFVGAVAGREFDRLVYRPSTIEIDPPRGDAEWPDGWEAVAEAAAADVADAL